jgi:hypothetical protein
MNLFRCARVSVAVLGTLVGGCAAADAGDDSDEAAAAVIGTKDTWCQQANNFDAQCVPQGKAVWITKVLEVSAPLQSHFATNAGRKLCFGEARLGSAFADESLGQRSVEAVAVWLQGSYGPVSGGCYTTKTFTRDDVLLFETMEDGAETVLRLSEADRHYAADKRWGEWVTTRSGEGIDQFIRVVGAVEGGRLKELCSGSSTKNCQVTVVNGRLAIKAL